jgi:hypothetical protein
MTKTKCVRSLNPKALRDFQTVTVEFNLYDATLAIEFLETAILWDTDSPEKCFDRALRNIETTLFLHGHLGLKFETDEAMKFIAESAELTGVTPILELMAAWEALTGRKFPHSLASIQRNADFIRAKKQELSAN